MQLDVADPNSIAALKAGLGDTPLDYLVNNAGIASSTAHGCVTVSGPHPGTTSVTASGHDRASEVLILEALTLALAGRGGPCLGASEHGKL